MLSPTPLTPSFSFLLVPFHLVGATDNTRRKQHPLTSCSVTLTGAGLHEHRFSRSRLFHGELRGALRVSICSTRRPDSEVPTFCFPGCFCCAPFGAGFVQCAYVSQSRYHASCYRADGPSCPHLLFQPSWHAPPIQFPTVILPELCLSGVI